MTKNEKNVTNSLVTKLANENKRLQQDMKILGSELTYFKELCADLENEVNRKEEMIQGLKANNKKLSSERNDLLNETFKRIEESNRLFGELQDIKALSMFEFAAKYCNNDELEEAGKAFAQSLIGGH